MRRLKPVSRLVQRTAHVLSSRIWKFLKKHSKSSCKYCSKLIPIDKCSKLESVKAFVLQLPVCCLQLIYDNLIEDAGNRTLLYNHYERCRLFWNVAWVCHCKELIIDGFFYGLHDIYLLKRFGQNMQCLDFSGGTVCIWILLLSFSKNIRELRVYCVNISESLLKAIGQHCQQIKIFHASVSDIPPEMILSLCFKDPKTQKFRHPCCDTFQEIHLDANVYASAKEKLTVVNIILKRIHTILLKNMTNLKSLGKSFELDTYLTSISDSPIPRTKIAQGYCSALSPDTLMRVCAFAPNIERLRMHVAITNGHYLNALYDLDCLRFLAIENYPQLEETRWDSVIYEHLLSSQYQNLEHLVFEGLDLEVLNISVFADNLPNLRFLELTSYHQSLWNGTSYFTCLEKLSVLRINPDPVYDLTWFASFSKTIKQVILLCSTQDISAPLCVTTLLRDPYPQLETLALSCLACDAKMLIDIVENCPQLSYFSGINCPELNAVQKYLRNKNIDCGFHGLY